MSLAARRTLCQHSAGQRQVARRQAIITLLVVKPTSIRYTLLFAPGIRVAAQWEKGVVLRLGRFVGLRGPGVFYVFRGLESALFVDTRLLRHELQHELSGMLPLAA